MGTIPGANGRTEDGGKGAGGKVEASKTVTEAVLEVSSTARKTLPSWEVTIRPKMFKPTTDRKNSQLIAFSKRFSYSMMTLSHKFS